MRAHVLLKIKVGKLIITLELEKLRQLVIGVDLATIALVLKVVGANVRVDLAGHLGARHLGANRLAKEGRQARC